MQQGSDAPGTVITVGTFDGVHLGHRKVLNEVTCRARERGRKSVLVTFEPHPLEVVNPGAAPRLLTLADERREILAQSELDVVAFLRFTPELSRFSPDDFVRLLIARFDMRELVIGYDHGFGKGRAGDVTLLRVLGKRLGFGVEVVPEVDVGPRSVSSTRIRRAIAGGDLKEANLLLGRAYSMNASVVPGAHRGRGLGYRTINLAVGDDRKLLPPDGVYAVRVEWASGSAGGMMHLGPRPTFGEADRSMEVHLIDTDEALYGSTVKVSWADRLRDVKQFGSSSELVEQLARDLEAARSALTRTTGLSSY